MLNINDLRQLHLGTQGENHAQTITIDLNPWLVDHPGASAAIWHKRNGDSVPSATGAELDSVHGTISWSPSSTDTFVAGRGEAEIRLIEGSMIKKSRKVVTAVSPSVTDAAGAVLSGWQEYIDAIQRAAGIVLIKGGNLKFHTNDEGHLILSYIGDVPIVPPDGSTTTVDEEGWTNIDLGPVDAYSLAVEGGYTKTKAEFEVELANVAANAAAAAEAAVAAQEAADAAAASSVGLFIDDDGDICQNDS